LLVAACGLVESGTTSAPDGEGDEKQAGNGAGGTDSLDELDPTPVPDDPGKCERIGGWNGEPDESIGDISVPRLTLDDGFEFVDAVAPFVLARRGDVYRSFEVVDCDVEELALPESVRGMGISQGPNNLIACSATECVVLVQMGDASDPTDPCSRPRWVEDAWFDEADLLGVSSTGESQCWWTSSTFQCSTSAILPAPENFEIEHATAELCVVSRSERTCYMDGAWAEPEPLEYAPPEPECGGSWALDNGLGFHWEFTESGGVLGWTNEECVEISPPLGPAVAVGAMGCACTMNPLLVTQTQVFTTCDCINCK
jgi:hypothetical protein